MIDFNDLTLFAQEVSNSPENHGEVIKEFYVDENNKVIVIEKSKFLNELCREQDTERSNRS